MWLEEDDDRREYMQSYYEKNRQRLLKKAKARYNAKRVEILAELKKQYANVNERRNKPTKVYRKRT